MKTLLEVFDLTNEPDIITKIIDMQNNNPLKQYDCDNCGEMTLTPVFAEVEINRGSNNDYAAEVDEIVIRCFCSEDCKNEYLSA